MAAKLLDVDFLDLPLLEELQPPQEDPKHRQRTSAERSKLWREQRRIEELTLLEKLDKAKQEKEKLKQENKKQKKTILKMVETTLTTVNLSVQALMKHLDDNTIKLKHALQTLQENSSESDGSSETGKELEQPSAKRAKVPLVLDHKRKEGETNI